MHSGKSLASNACYSPVCLFCPSFRSFTAARTPEPPTAASARGQISGTPGTQFSSCRASSQKHISSSEAPNREYPLVPGAHADSSLQRQVGCHSFCSTEHFSLLSPPMIPTSPPRCVAITGFHPAQTDLCVSLPSSTVFHSPRVWLTCRSSSGFVQATMT
jgi:hypothetical protein